jgi:hypothetical protein
MYSSNDLPASGRRRRRAYCFLGSGAPAKKRAQLGAEDIGELAAAAKTIADIAGAVVPLLHETAAAEKLLEAAIHAREQRYRRGDVNPVVESGPRPTEGHPVDCDVCHKPVHAGGEILSPFGDWIHKGFCHARAVIYRELGGNVKPGWMGYILIPRP